MTSHKKTLSHNLKSIHLVVATSLAMTIAGTGGASAITAKLTKTCEAATSKAFPPRQIGNPAAGSAMGNSKVQRNYYNKCVANGGRVDEAEKK